MTFFVDYKVGYHTKKHPKLVDSITSLPTFEIPYQIFLGGPQNTKINISEKELVETFKFISEKNVSVYVHSQYIINLCSEEPYVIDLLIKNLEYAKKAGFKGVVVHTGKYTKKGKKEALDIMRVNIALVLPHATPECPLILETPSGQGTETLTECKEFVDFVKEFKGLRICVDTCHVFASGYEDPLSYIQYIDPSLIRLVHLNDSKTDCASCVDRHEHIGEGFIGLKKLTSVAEYCLKNQIHMIYE